ncbi:ankyrin-1-like isoform X2 [Pseudomyrmex gracilis]|uniref:ankyrin-1-like isoform X2 n=1 Tax=Pseudomyrmex gracilis TaxID=219809 RepID=UPI000995A01C|nr:ankyrin-1-like isoform X2 [Pseudomyrmex gracilis]
MDYIDTSYTLIRAVREGNLERAREILTYFGLSYSQAWKEGYVLLCDAIENRHTEVIKLLLTNGSKVNSNTDEYDNDDLGTPLHLAVINGDIELVKMLLDRGANVNAETQEGTTLLHNAIVKEEIEIAELLLNHGANVNARDKSGVTPLCLAVKKRHISGVKLLLDRGANVNAETRNGTTLLHNAINYKNKKIAELLLNHGAIVNASDRYGVTPLYFAIKSGRVDGVKMLLDRGANVNAKTRDGTTPLHDAIKYEKIEIAELLLNHGANLTASDKSGISLLCLAVQKGHVNVVKMFLDRGANVNAEIPGSCRTPLHYAIEYEKMEIAELLLNHGGVTPLYFAIQREHVDGVKMLLDRGANVNHQNQWSSKTLLHYAMQNKQIEIAELLLNHGATVNASDRSGFLSLCCAVYSGHVDTVKMLLDRGANINTISYKNYRCFNHCYYCKEIAEILEQHIVKMETANLYVSEHLSMSHNYKMKDLQDKCEKEVAILKNEKISNTNISFHDILIKDTNPLAKYMRNENVVQVLRSDEYKTKFPIYSSMIKNQFRKGLEKKELFEQGTKSFYLFCNCPELPLECIDQIFGYLSDTDIRILIDTCKSGSVSNFNTDIHGWVS